MVVSVKTHSSTNFPPGLVRRVILVGGYAIQHDLGWRRRLRRVVSIAQKVLLYRNICSWYQLYICFGFRLLNILCTLFIIIVIFSLCSPCLPQLAHTHTHTHTRNKYHKITLHITDMHWDSVRHSSLRCGDFLCGKNLRSVVRL